MTTEIRGNAILNKRDSKNVILHLNKRERDSRSLVKCNSAFKHEFSFIKYNTNYINLVHQLRMIPSHAVGSQPHCKVIRNLNFKHDGSILLSNIRHRSLDIWDWNNQRIMANIKYFSSHVNKILNFPSCSRIVYASCETTVGLLEVGEARMTFRDFRDHEDVCVNLIVYPNRPFVFVSGGKEGTIFRHDIRNRGTDIISDCTQVTTYNLTSIEVHPQNEYEFCTCSWFAGVARFDERMPNQIIARYGNKNYRRYFDKAIYNHDGSEILASNCQHASLYNINLNRSIRHFPGYNLNFDFSGKESELIIGQRSDLQLWNKTTCNLYSVTRGMWFTAVATHPKQHYICTGDRKGDIKIWSPVINNI